ncbi:MAG TPA: DUF929 family protein, partial [Marmoricola sp.]|nr:DUF929 family protein [Marmoricola sp.]
MTKIVAVSTAVVLAFLSAGCGPSTTPKAASTPRTTGPTACSMQAVACGGPTAAATPAPIAEAAGILGAITDTPASEFDVVGVPRGSVFAVPTAIKTPTMTKNGKPRILYIGAEWCPFCAAQRWPLAIALSRFGTFKDLGQTASSAMDVYPGTPSLSFYRSRYTSKYVSLDAYELQDNARNTLVTLSRSDASLFNTVGGSGFPFIDIAGKYKASTMYEPGLLHVSTSDQYSSPLTYAQIESA